MPMPMNSLKYGSVEETQNMKPTSGLVPHVERKYTHNIHLFVIKYINIILGNLLSVPSWAFANQMQSKNA